MQPRLSITLAFCLALAACSHAVDRDSAVSNGGPERAAEVKTPMQVAPLAPAPPERLDDDSISERVEASLRSDAAMRGADISVNTSQGVVNLNGLVKSREQAAQAVVHANQDGVVRVDDHLAVEVR